MGRFFPGLPLLKDELKGREKFSLFQSKSSSGGSFHGLEFYSKSFV